MYRTAAVDHPLAPGRSRGRSRNTTDVGLRVVYLLIGFTPIVTLALSLLEVVPLHAAAPVTIATAVAMGTWLLVAVANQRLLVLRGLVAGLIAVLIYDCTRWPFVLYGGWPDFIPNIGVWLRADPDAHWSVGYLWRYLGNGAGMGLAFTVMVPVTYARIDPRLAGLLYGLAIWSGLLITLVASPNGEEKMFVLSPATVALSLVGHIVYGTILGLGAHHHRSVIEPRVV